jgi:ribose-phosphate pyrophosphokinase
MVTKSKQLVLLGNSVSPETEVFFSESNGFQRIPASIGEFPSGEPFVELFHKQEDRAAENAALLKGKDVIVVQSGGVPYASNILTLLMMVDTLKSYGVASVTAYVQMLPLARQDRKFENRFVSEGARFMAKMLDTAEGDRIVTVTPHSQGCIQTFRSFFQENFIAIDTAPLFAADIRARFNNAANVVIGAPDGADKPKDEGQRRAKELSLAVFGKDTDSQLFKIAKQHVPGTVSETRIAGFDESMRSKVEGKDCVIVDDMIDGGGTMVNAAALLKENGAKSVTCYATHGILTGNALEKMFTKPDISQAPIDQLVVTDTLPDTGKKVEDFIKKYPDLSGRIDILCTAPLLKEALAPAKKAGPKPPRL